MTDTKLLLKQLNEKLDKAYKVDQTKFLEKNLVQLNDAAASNKLRTTWAIVNEISGKGRNITTAKVKKAVGTKINSTKELNVNGGTISKSLLT